jgi:hypothetical protein
MKVQRVRRDSLPYRKLSLNFDRCEDRGQLARMSKQSPRFFLQPNPPHAEALALASLEACAASTERGAHPSRPAKWRGHLRGRALNGLSLKHLSQ